MSKDKKMDIRLMITREDMIEKVTSGEKTAIRRQQRFADVGDTFELEGSMFKITDVYQQQLADLTNQAAQDDGFDILEAYTESTTSIHDGAVWVPKWTVWAHDFNAISEASHSSLAGFLYSCFIVFQQTFSCSFSIPM